MNWAELAGMTGGLMTTLSMVPQIYRIVVLKSARDVGLPFCVMLTEGFVAWIVYGVALGLLSVTLWSCVELVLGIAMIYAKVRWGR